MLALCRELLRGGAEIIPQVVGSDPNGPEFTISWVPKVLEVRANGQSDLVNIAQIFQRSGTRSVSWAAGKGPGTTSDLNITSPEQFAGLNIGVWDFGNEYEVTAAGLLYVAVTAAVMGLVPHDQLVDDGAPFVAAFDAMFDGGWIGKLVALTAVISGSYNDGIEDYAAGDLSLASGIEHTPIATGTETCVCLVVYQRPIIFSGTFSRLANPRRWWRFRG